MNQDVMIPFLHSFFFLIKDCQERFPSSLQRILGRRFQSRKEVFSGQGVENRLAQELLPY